MDAPQVPVLVKPNPFSAAVLLTGDKGRIERNIINLVKGHISLKNCAILSYEIVTGPQGSHRECYRIICLPKTIQSGMHWFYNANFRETVEYDKDLVSIRWVNITEDLYNRLHKLLSSARYALTTEDEVKSERRMPKKPKSIEQQPAEQQSVEQSPSESKRVIHREIFSIPANYEYNNAFKPEVIRKHIDRYTDRSNSYIRQIQEELVAFGYINIFRYEITDKRGTKINKYRFRITDGTKILLNIDLYERISNDLITAGYAMSERVRLASNPRRIVYTQTFKNRTNQY